MTKTTKGESNNTEKKYTLCSEFMKLVHLVMDEEASKDEEELFLAYLNGSRDCKDHYLEEQEIRKILKEKCGSIEVPKHLIQLIQTKLQEQKIA